MQSSITTTITMLDPAIKSPNFFIVGAAKGGTTSLYHYLAAHPQIYMSKIKEPHYFSRDITTESFREDYLQDTKVNIHGSINEPVGHIAHISNWDDYLKLFRAAGTEKAIGECSTGYLYSAVAASEIKQAIPDAKIVMVLRNPVERAFSHFLMDLRVGVAPATTFRKAVTTDYSAERKGWGISSLYVELGLYFEQVKRYLDIFSEENVKIFLYDDIRDDCLSAVRDLFRFLEVDETFGVDTSARFNTAKVPRFPKLHAFLTQTGIKRIGAKLIPPDLAANLKNLFLVSAQHQRLSQDDADFLMPYFSEDIQRLARLINRDLVHWQNYPYRIASKPGMACNDICKQGGL